MFCVLAQTADFIPIQSLSKKWTTAYILINAHGSSAFVGHKHTNFIHYFYIFTCPSAISYICRNNMSLKPAKII